MKIKEYSVFSIYGRLGSNGETFVKYNHSYAIFQRYNHECRLDTWLTRLLFFKIRT